MSNSRVRTPDADAEAEAEAEADADAVAVPRKSCNSRIGFDRKSGDTLLIADIDELSSNRKRGSQQRFRPPNCSLDNPSASQRIPWERAHAA